MRVILMKDVKGVGRKADVVEVADGYARNFLLAQGLAKEATISSVSDLKHRQAERAEKEAQMHAELEELARKLSGVSVIVKAKPNKSGGLFAAVNERVIAAELTKMLGKEVEDRSVIMTNPIKELGDFEILWSPADDIKQTVRVSVEKDD